MKYPLFDSLIYYFCFWFSIIDIIKWEGQMGRGYRGGAYGEGQIVSLHCVVPRASFDEHR